MITCMSIFLHHFSVKYLQYQIAVLFLILVPKKYNLHHKENIKLPSFIFLKIFNKKIIIKLVSNDTTVSA